jgi:hypothetical protein
VLDLLHIIQGSYKFLLQAGADSLGVVARPCDLTTRLVIDASVNGAVFALGNEVVVFGEPVA